jgi:hypothetical protein
MLQILFSVFLKAARVASCLPPTVVVAASFGVDMQQLDSLPPQAAAITTTSFALPSNMKTRCQRRKEPEERDDGWGRVVSERERGEEREGGLMSRATWSV